MGHIAEDSLLQAPRMENRQSQGTQVFLQYDVRL